MWELAPAKASRVIINLELAGYIAALCAGLILGLLGGGGSILSIPILVYLFRLETSIATGYSLFIVGIATLVGCIIRLRLSILDIGVGMKFGLPAVLGSFVARMWLVPIIPGQIIILTTISISQRALILGLFSVLTISASFYMVFANNKLNKEIDIERNDLLMLSGTAIGLLTGIVGMGGGFLIVPAIYFLTNLDLRKSIGTGLFIIAAKSLIGFMGDLSNFPINWIFLIGITSITTVGIIFGTHASRIIEIGMLKRVFGFFVLAMGVLILTYEFFR